MTRFLRKLEGSSTVFFFHPPGFFFFAEVTDRAEDKGEDMSLVNHSFGDGPQVQHSDLLLMWAQPPHKFMKILPKFVTGRAAPEDERRSVFRVTAARGYVPLQDIPRYGDGRYFDRPHLPRTGREG